MTNNPMLPLELKVRISKKNTVQSTIPLNIFICAFEKVVSSSLLFVGK